MTKPVALSAAMPPCIISCLPILPLMFYQLHLISQRPHIPYDDWWNRGFIFPSPCFNSCSGLMSPLEYLWNSGQQRCVAKCKNKSTARAIKTCQKNDQDPHATCMWRHAVERRGMKVSENKIKYMCVNKKGVIVRSRVCSSTCGQPSKATDSTQERWTR